MIENRNNDTNIVTGIPHTRRVFGLFPFAEILVIFSLIFYYNAARKIMTTK